MNSSSSLVIEAQIMEARIKRRMSGKSFCYQRLESWIQ